MKKAILRKTGEVVEIIHYRIFDYTNYNRVPDIDKVSYIDSKGNEFPNQKLNYYWDFIKIDEKVNNERSKIAENLLYAIERRNGIYMSQEDTTIDYVVRMADKLIKKLNE